MEGWASEASHILLELQPLIICIPNVWMPLDPLVLLPNGHLPPRDQDAGGAGGLAATPALVWFHTGYVRTRCPQSGQTAFPGNPGGQGPGDGVPNDTNARMKQKKSPDSHGNGAKSSAGRFGDIKAGPGRAGSEHGIRSAAVEQTRARTAAQRSAVHAQKKHSRTL